MDHVAGMLLATRRDHGTDLAFSALPHAPRRESTGPGPVRRALGRGLLSAAHRLEPATRSTPRPTDVRASSPPR